MKNIGIRIKTKRKLAGLTQSQLAVLIGVTKAAVSRWETGRNALETSTLTVLAETLKVEPEWLLTGDMLVNPQDVVDAIFWAPIHQNVKGVIESSEIKKEYLPIPSRYVQSLENKGKIYCVAITGDSMCPVLHNNSFVAVNSESKVIKEGRMYLIRQGELLRVRVVHQKPSRIVLKCYNPSFGDEEYSYYKSDMNILGEVIWYCSGSFS